VGLAEVGLVEAQNLAVEYRFADGDLSRLGGMAAVLVQRGVALIVAGGVAAAVAATAVTPTIPIVFVTGADPVDLGLAGGRDRPAGNVTGVTFVTAGLFEE